MPQPLLEMINGIPNREAREDIQDHLVQPPEEEAREGLLETWQARLRLELQTLPPQQMVLS